VAIDSGNESSVGGSHAPKEPANAAPSKLDGGGDGGQEHRRAVTIAVLVAALGYFVDLFDLILFTVLRTPSLKAMAVDPVEWGRLIINWQLTGMLVGGVVWGVLGDRRGRLTVLFGSIIMYSVANLLNAFVVDPYTYAVLRFIAGFGLAGELGAGITLVSELLPTRSRGIGTTIVATVGLAGAVVAGLVGELLTTNYPVHGWRAAYAIGGVLGLMLLALRVGLLESGIFRGTADTGIPRGNIVMLLWPPERLFRFLRVILVGMPIWFAGGVLFVFSPEIGKALGLDPPPSAANVVVFAYVGVVLGDLASGLISQYLRRRKLVIGAFMGAYATAVVVLLQFGGHSPEMFYALMCLLGATTGYWVLFVTVASEQFGTNLRATVTTSAPNFVRGAAVPILDMWLVSQKKLGMTIIPATIAVGLTCIAIGFISLLFMRESFHTDLDYVER
jgi:MFS transporter, putative metabolite:H+ symporter